MLLLNNKGFLGPIGDDLPSLIPLLFALLIFFSTFTFTFDVYEKGVLNFRREIDLMRLSNTLKGDSYLRDYQEFEAACRQVNVSGINFKAVVLPLKFDSGPISIDARDLVNNETGVFEEESNQFTCDNLPASDSDDVIPSNANVLVRFFPIAYEDKDKCDASEMNDPTGSEMNDPTGNECIKWGFAVRPMLLVVVAWA